MFSKIVLGDKQIVTKLFDKETLYQVRVGSVVDKKPQDQTFSKNDGSPQPVFTGIAHLKWSCPFTSVLSPERFCVIKTIRPKTLGWIASQRLRSMGLIRMEPSINSPNLSVYSIAAERSIDPIERHASRSFFSEKHPFQCVKFNILQRSYASFVLVSLMALLFT